MKTEFKNFCKDHRLKFEGIRNDNFIASKLVARVCLVQQGKSLKQVITSKTRHFFVFDNTSGAKYDFSEKFHYREQLEMI